LARLELKHLLPLQAPQRLYQILFQRQDSTTCLHAAQFAVRAQSSPLAHLLPSRYFSVLATRSDSAYPVAAFWVRCVYRPTKFDVSVGR
jgi:hypothetical protein